MTFKSAVVTLGVSERLLVHFLLALEAELFDIVDVPLVRLRHVHRAGDLRSELLPAVHARIFVSTSLLHQRPVALRDVISQEIPATTEALAALRALLHSLVAQRHQAGFLVHVDQLVFPHECPAAEELSAN